MLEEPQAAFYAWIERHPDWRQRVGKGDLVLVVDIGGGTTDFTLIAVTEQTPELQLERVAVGEHILLGGDNIDLALAHTVAGDLARKGTKIDAFQLQALWNNCRLAKEKLLDPESKADEVPVTILGKGSSLIGGTIKAKLRREQIEQVLEGFLPRVASTEMPQSARAASASRKWACPMRPTPPSPGTSRVPASGGPAPAVWPAHPRPFQRRRAARAVRARASARSAEFLAGSEGLPPIQPLTGEDLMHAVARGAAYYGAARHGKGVRIRGGIAALLLRRHRIRHARRARLPAPLKALPSRSSAWKKAPPSAFPTANSA
jgi:hypothetical protein